ncbi:MAG TPA: S53 family peptidase [Rhizomicrobium sp.]|nr:S53 family peptidase [Rhizomicrobium sp.]
MISNAPRPTREELAVKTAELQVRKLEAAKALAAADTPWWRRADPLVLAILAGVFTLVGNMAVALYNGSSSVTQEERKAANDLALEQTKARYNLVLQAMATNDAEVAKRNIHFFIDAGLLTDADCRIRDAIDRDQPVLPALAGAAPPTPPGQHSSIEIATLYDFPSGYDGRGVTVGIIELGGAVVDSDMAQYFKSLNLPVPDVTSVSVDGGVPKSDGVLDSQVMTDVEVIGAIAPRSRIRVYFAPFTPQGIADAIARATADGAAVLSDGWGQAESEWPPGAIATIDAALQGAAERGVTVVAAAGDRGVSDGAADGRRHVDYPASSPWVLSVGATALKSKDGAIQSETVWRSGPDGFATGGGVSAIFPRPGWQSALAVSNLDNGKAGRGVPDVSASGDPRLGLSLIIHGQASAIGGTSAAAPLWAGLVARIDQALGYNVGYLNPVLYQGAGTAGAFHNVTLGDNGVGGLAGYKAGPGWNAVSGWGSPDGAKLLDWLRAHTSPPPQSRVLHSTCQVASR